MSLTTWFVIVRICFAGTVCEFTTSETIGDEPIQNQAVCQIFLGMETARIIRENLAYPISSVASVCLEKSNDRKSYQYG